MTKYNQYRVIRVATVEELAKLSDPNEVLQRRRQPKNVSLNRDEYYLDFFSPCNLARTSQIDKFNLGVNPVSNAEMSKMSQIDFIM